MTKISYIQAIPPDEAADRGRSVEQLTRQYIPYLSLTTGEMRLELLRQRMQMFSRYYPDVKEYSRAVQMIDDVLKAGVHRGVSFVGAVPDELQNVAAVIAESVRQTKPAAGILFGRKNPINGIGEIIPVSDSQKRFDECIKRAPLPPWGQKERQQCRITFEIERIYNDYLEKIGHHTIYNQISADYPEIPSRVFTKLVLHDAGVEGMANAATLEKSIVSDWLENGVLAKNAAIGAGLIDSVTTSFYLSPSPDSHLSKYVIWQQQRKGAKINAVDPATITVIITAIVTVLAAVSDFLLKLRAAKAYAMSEARGFGTSAYSAAQSDWPIGPGNPTTGEQNTKTLGIVAAAAGAYMLLNDE